LYSYLRSYDSSQLKPQSWDLRKGIGNIRNAHILGGRRGWLTVSLQIAQSTKNNEEIMYQLLIGIWRLGKRKKVGQM